MRVCRRPATARPWRGRLRRRQDQSPRRARSGSETARDVHRVYRDHRLASPRVRGCRQLNRRGAGGILRSGQRPDPHRQLGHGDRQRSRHSCRPPRERQVRGGSGADRSARRRQVRQRQLQGLGRPARRRHLGRQRALGAARARDLAGRPGLSADLRAGYAGGRPRGHGHDEEARHEGHLQAGQLRSSRRSSSASTRSPSACASSRFSTAASRSRSTTSATARGTSSSTKAASSRSSSI